MPSSFNFNGCNKLEKNSFNNILAMKISVLFEFNSTDSSSADTSLDDSATYVQKGFGESRLLLLTCTFQQYRYKFKSIFYK